LGNTEHALDDVPNWNPGYHNLQEVRRACLWARDVVKQILSFSRSSIQPLKPIRIAPIIKESLKLIRSSIPTTIEIRQDIVCLFNTIKADPTQFNQILLNLCTNAAYAMMDSGGTLSVRLDNIEINKTTPDPHHKLTPGRYLELTVSDTGHGIDPEILGRIFDPYFTTKEIGEGTGIGLAVAHGIVHKYGGEITVKSQINKGTSFYVYLPCIEDKILLAHRSDKSPLPTGNERILFIDDEQNMVDTVSPLLERLGYCVEATTDISEALETFLSDPEKHDLIITDQTMPHMTGIEFVKQIREHRQGLPIILCTGFSESIDEDRAMEFGINAFMMKPFEVHEIAHIVRRVLDRNKTP
jgi:CheY-like chemotaxis protein